MKKFFSILAATAMSVTMIPATASALEVNTIALGEGICSTVTLGEAGKEGINCNDLLDFINKINCNAPSYEIWKDLFCQIPGIDCDTPSGDTEVVPPVQDNDTPAGDTETAPPQEDNDASTENSAMNEYEKEVIRLVNVIRAENGLGELVADEELSRVARIKSQDMKDNNYFSHTSPTYGSPFEMMNSFGISYKTAGENIAKGYKTPQAVVDGWMNSEGHRANILNASFNTIGVGYVADGNYWTQMFVGR